MKIRDILKNLTKYFNNLSDFSESKDEVKIFILFIFINKLFIV